jgi:inorganic triphosphatase YgiF
MNGTSQTAIPFTEVELKLALPSDDPSNLEQRLARLPVLARRKVTHERLHNTYYDTPDDLLNRQRTALRIRRVGSEEPLVWLQTLKMGGSGDSALSQRGEWEAAVPSAALRADRLRVTPWLQLDPEGTVFQSLTPRFTTDFTRTRWTVRNRDGSVVEVALDQGRSWPANTAHPFANWNWNSNLANQVPYLTSPVKSPARLRSCRWEPAKHNVALHWHVRHWTNLRGHNRPG